MTPTRRAWITVGAVLVVVPLFAYQLIGCRTSLPDGLIQASGRIEGDIVTVSGSFGGRLIELTADEGDTVAEGAVLARLEDRQLPARIDQARGAVAALDARIGAAETACRVLKESVPLQVARAEAAVAHGRTAVGKAGTAERQARQEAERLRSLAEAGVADAQSSERAELSWATARDELALARSALVVAERSLDESKLAYGDVVTAAREIDALRGERARARAAVAEIESVLKDLEIRAPSAGVVANRLAEVGEVVAAGAALYDLVDLDRLYLKVYVPEIEIGKVRLGLPARVHVDSFPDTFVEAAVRYISPRAEFVPKDVQTPDERVKLVFAVKLSLLANPEHRLTPGLPADAVIRFKQDVPWAPPVH